MDTSTNVTICTKNCPDGYFGDTINGYCYKCGSQCSTCVFEANKCLKCNTLLKYTKVAPDSFECVPLQCKIGFFENIVNGEYVCSKCHSNCKSCIGSENTHCIECSKSIGYIFDSTKSLTGNETYLCLTCEQYDVRLATPTSGKIPCIGNLIIRNMRRRIQYGYK